MRILFIHQNFPSQFVHLAQALAEQGHEVCALGIHCTELPQIRTLRYIPQIDPVNHAPLLVRDIAVKSARGLGVAAALMRLRQSGYLPEVVVAFSGWGESLFVKDVWPHVPLLCYLEFFYQTQGADHGFDPEFGAATDEALFRLRLRNAPHLMAMHAMDWGLTPTHWQHSTLPLAYRERTSVIFDGIDTEQVCPKEDAVFKIPNTTLELTRQDSVVTFVNRNLEPYRGCHVFLRALPGILNDTPDAKVVIVGDTGVSYGAPAPDGKSWKDIFLEEIKGSLPAGWENRVFFVGRLPYADFVRLFQVSTCHVYLTYPFVLSWSCLEAMSAGCTVLASQTAPVQEVINDQEHGFLFDFFDGQGLRERVGAVLAEPAKYKHLGQAARQRVVERYDLKTKSLPAQISLLNALVTGLLPAPMHRR